ncbi:Peptidase family M28 [Fontibacillus panacisegetis]|uniref:Peptidase family M28 n=1 Tax=Fontibacillus panacisegetis TaxID=670482 RepID=A0A1G7UVF9_9BACL|nr:M28 family peptidase [Fontibacillus panacisegetis]SDG51585.1 Peptidase family M28 [Fontibacillus panacisegetis]
MVDFLKLLSKERPVGTKTNTELVKTVEKYLYDLGYSIHSLPFDCMVWNSGASAIKIDNQSIAIEPSPFSEPFNGSGKLNIVKTLEQLENINCKDAILVLAEDMTRTPLQPKNYPFYYPDEHKKIISLLEKKQPKAIIAVTGKNSLNGQNPFPLFEDGNFLIPSGNIGKGYLKQIDRLAHLGIPVSLVIDSYKTEAKSRQIVASKKAKKSAGKIIIGAHMDTKYNTPGALDNAAGVAVLLQTAQSLNSSVYDIDIVPFNSEEFYGANGELEYLKLLDSESKKIALMINIDSPCHKGSETAISFHNLSKPIVRLTNSLIANNPKITKGKEWYAGDHTPFIFRGIPCMVVTSSDFFDGALQYTHTPKDTLDTVDFEMVKPTAQHLIDVIDSLSARECKRRLQIYK